MSSSEFLRLLIGTLLQEHINKDTGWLQLPFANQRLSYGTPEALMRLQARSVLKIFTPNVTRKKITFSLMTQPNANSLP